MTEETKIVLSVDTTDVAQAGTDLDKMAAAGKRAEGAAGALEKGLESVGTAAAGVGKSVAAIGAATDGASAAIAKTGTAATALAGALSAVDGKVEDTASGMSRVSAATGEAARELAQMGRSTQSATAALASQGLAALESATANTQAAASFRVVGEAAVKQLAAQAALSNATVAAASAQAAYNKSAADSAVAQGAIAAAASKGETAQAALAAATLASSRAQEASNKASASYQSALGKTAQQTKLTAFETQQLGFQLNDLFVQIASGQSPLTALIQQGSQLSGTFGGLRGTFAALATVFTASRLVIGGTVAAIAGVALAAKSGADESTDLARSLALTGNAAGLTEGKFNALAASIARATDTSIGGARETLSALVASGRLSGDALTSVFTAVQTGSKATGQSTEELSKQFLGLVKDVGAGAASLNERFNFLSAAQLKNIQDTQAQGDTQKALVLTFDALNDRFKEAADKSGLLSRAYNNLEVAASAALNAIKGIGRAETPEEQADKLRSRIASRVSVALGGYTATAGTSGTSNAADVAELSRLEAEIRLNTKISEEKARQVDLDTKKTEFGRLQEQTLTIQEQLGKRISEYASKGVAAQIDPAEIARGVEAITKASAAYAQVLDVSLANLQGRFTVQATRLAGELTAAQAALALGQINEYEAIEKTAKVQEDILRSKLAELAATRAITAARPNSAAAVVQLDQAADNVREQIAQNIKRREESIAIALNKRKRAADALLITEREQIDAEQSANRVKIDERYYQASAAVQDYTRSVDLSIEAAEFELSLQGASSAQRAIALAQFQIEIQRRERIRQLQNLPESQRLELTAQINEQAVRESAAAAAKITADSFSAVRQQISDSITDGILDGGKSAAEELERIFKKLVLRPIVQAGVEQVLGLVGLGTGANGTANAAQNAQSLQSLISLASGAYKAGTAAYGYVAGTGYLGADAAYAAAADTALATSGNVYAGSAAAGASGSSFFTSGNFYALLAAAAYNRGNAEYNAGFTGQQNAARKNQIFGEDAIGQSVSSLTVDNILYKLGLKLGMNDRWASVLSGATAVAQIIGRGAPQVEGRNIVGTVDGSGFNGTFDTRIREKGGLFRSDRVTTVSDALSGDIDRAIDESTAKIREQAKKYGAALGLPVEQIDAISRSFNVDVTFATQEEAVQRIQDELANYGTSLVDSFAPALEIVKNLGETTAQTIERLAGNILGINAVFDQLGLKALESSVNGGKAAQSLADLFGGVQGVTNAASVYYEQFFSEAERSANATRLLTKAFADVGLTIPASREAYRSLVEEIANGAAITTDAGQKQFQALLSLAGAYAELNPLIEQSTVAVRSAADIASERNNLETQLLQLQGNTAELRARERAALDGTNQALFDTIKALEDSQAAAAKLAQEQSIAAQAAAAQAENIASERAGLERRILELQGDTTAIRALERAALDESNRALYDRINALTDAAAAEELAARTVQEAANAAARAQEQLAKAMEQAATAARSGVERAYSDLVRIGDEERRRIAAEADAGINTLEKQASAAQSAFDDLSRSLGGLVGSLRDTASSILAGLDPEQARASAVATLQTQLAIARAGGPINIDAAQSAASLVGQSDPRNFASAVDFRRDALRNAALVGDLATAAQDQLNAAQARQQAELAKIQEAITEIGKGRDEQFNLLDDQLKQAELQYRALLGINTSVETVAGAIAKLTQALAAQAALTNSSAIGSVATNTVLRSGDTEVYRALGGAVATRAAGAGIGDFNIQGLQTRFTGSEAQAFAADAIASGNFRALYDRAVAEGIDSASLDALLGLDPGTSLRKALELGFPAFASGGYHSGGARIVGERGPELAVTGPERIYSFDNLLTLAGGGKRDEALVAEIKALRAEVAAANARAQAAMDAVVLNTAKTAKTIDQWNEEGQPEVRT